ncbi:MAG: hypothetical protein AB1657_00230 [Candidatus Micrarchaeota archaeon]
MIKTLEATISLVVLLSFLSFGLLHYPVQHSRLYEYELAEDAWRVLYLKGGFDVWELETGNRKLNEDAEEITELTGLCVAMDGLQVASCLPGEGAIVLHKTVSSGGEPIQVLFRMGPKTSEGIPSAG